MNQALEELRALDRDLFALECAQARENFAVYCGLQMPQDIEKDDDDDGEPLDHEDLPKVHERIADRYVPAAHHRLLCEKLQDLERGYIVEKGEKIPFDRLMIFAPPGSAKSTYASVLFPAWFMGKHPTKSIIQGSYNDSLATRFGRRARNTFSTDVHRSVFNVGVSKDVKAAGEWATEKGGEYFTFGINAGVTGRRAHGIILDDLIKGRNEANSKTTRDSTWETYKSDVRTRKFPDTWIIYIATRWHEDDPAGRILPANWNGESGWVTAKDGERWYVLCMVAVIETKDEERKDPLKRKVGEFLWPEWFTKKFFDQEKVTQGPYNWASLYQQRPQPIEGGIFKRRYFRLWPPDKPLPLFHFIIQSYDTAYTEKTANDPTCCTVWGLFKYRGNFNVMLLDAWKDYLEYPKLRRRVKLDQKAEYGEGDNKRIADLILIEQKGSGISLIQDLGTVGILAWPYNPKKEDKVVRLQAATPFGAAGMVWLLESNKRPGQPIQDHDEFMKDVIKASADSDEWDYADTFSQAMLYFRNQKMIEAKISTGEDEVEPEVHQPKTVHPYGG